MEHITTTTTIDDKILSPSISTGSRRQQQVRRTDPRRKRSNLNKCKRQREERSHRDDEDYGEGADGEEIITERLVEEQEPHHHHHHHEQRRRQEERLVIFAEETEDCDVDMLSPSVSCTPNVVQPVDEEHHRRHLRRRRKPIGKILFVTNPTRRRARSSYADSFHQNRHSSPSTSSTSPSVHVEIVSLFVQRQYRGRNLGRILFLEMIKLLRIRHRSYVDDDGNVLPSIHVTFVAEEDTRCYNRLVNFYCGLGCTVMTTKKQDKKRKLRSDNDDDDQVSNLTTKFDDDERLVYNTMGDDSYRRVPMELYINDIFHDDGPQDNESPLKIVLSNSSLFLPVEFRSCLKEIVSHRQQQWVMTFDEDGTDLQLHCASDSVLNLVVVDDDDLCFGINTSSPRQQLKTSAFRIIQFRQDGDTAAAVPTVIQSRCGTFYLSLCRNGPSLTTKAFFWEFDKKTWSFLPSSMNTTDKTTKLSRPSDCANARKAQRNAITDINATKARIDYQAFNQVSMSLHDALLLAKELPAASVSFIFHATKSNPSYTRVDQVLDISLRMFLFQMAELARDAGHPDWFQLTAILCGLSSVLNDTTTVRNGASYMVRMLQNNNVGLPDESYDILKMFAVSVDECIGGDGGEFPSMQNSQKMNPFAVMELYEILSTTETTFIDQMAVNGRHSTGGAVQHCGNIITSESQCDELWEEYYSHVATKYGITTKGLEW
jgi:ribosomal protein S18 acetylase RimI-like enzyme